MLEQYPLHIDPSSFRNLTKENMMKRTLLTALFVVALPASSAFAAITIDKITASPSPVKAGQPIHVTIDARNAEEGVCGLGLKWGDGSSEKPEKVGGRHKTFPLTFQHTYAAAGSYKIKAEGTRADTYLGCLGKADIIVTVEAVAAAAPATPEKVTCPANWKMKGKPAKDGSYTCNPAKNGAAKPDKPLDCPAGTAYFMSSKALGCEKE